MNAFDPIKKHKPNKMALDLVHASTEDIIDFLIETQTSEQEDALAELKNTRIIKSVDSDAGAKYTGGVRPQHQPLNP